MNTSDRVKLLINKQNLTQKKFAETIGISPARLNNYLAGLSKIPQDILVLISEKYQCSLTWLITGDGPMFQELQPINIRSGEFVRLPVSARIAAGRPIEALDEEPEEWIRVSRDILSLPPPYYVFKVEGDSMAPFILEGDYVVLSRNWQGVPLQGKICGFRTWEGITLKKLMLQSKGKVAWLIPINHSKYEPVAYSKDTEDLSMLGVLVVLIRKF